MHFFIDHTKLTPQLLIDQYGPVTGNLTTQYNVTSRFQLTEPAHAFACEHSMMIIQQSEVDASLLNVILKPLASRSEPSVAYYIYRGILRNTLLNGLNVLGNDALFKSELIFRLNKANPFNTLSSPLSAAVIGYDNNTLSDTDSIENIFNQSKPIIKPVYVKEGEWFGDFTKDHKIGFEIICETDKINVSLGFVRKEKTTIDTVVGGNTLTGLALRSKREEILSFIDPAAFFGSHSSKGVSYSEITFAPLIAPFGFSKTTRTAKSEIYTSLISNFATKKRIYLDIRSERGYSYNFYQNYHDSNNNNIRIGYGEGALSDAVYEVSGWPIFSFDTAQSTDSQKSRIRINLRVDDNVKPILYVKDRMVLTVNTVLDAEQETSLSNFVREADILNGSSTEWSKNIALYFRNAGVNNGGQRDNIANYIQLYYFRQRHNSVSFPDEVLKNERYFDSAFCSIDLPFLGSPSVPNGFIVNSALNYIREEMQTDGTGNFGYAASNGVFWNDSRILFYSKLEKGFSNSEKSFIKIQRHQELSINRNFASRFKSKLAIICRNYRYAEVSPTQTIRVIGVNYYNNGDTTHKEDVLFLGVSIDEIEAIKNLTGFSALHHRYIFLAEQPRLWNNGDPNTGDIFYEYNIQVQGLNDAGDRVILTPEFNGDPIRVYSRDRLFFSSRLFSQNEPLTSFINEADQNRIEFNILQNGKVFINDNIDLSLLHDYDNNTNQLRKRIHYRYHHGSRADYICNLQAFQVDKKKNGTNRASLAGSGPIPPIPPGYTLTINYDLPAPTPGVNAEQSYENADGDVITIGNYGGNSNYRMFYKHLDAKIFLVHVEEALVNKNDTVNNLHINLGYFETLRHYAAPQLAAAFIGVLAELGAQGIQSGGFSFKDGTCFPSSKHANGAAVDTRYKRITGGTPADDQAIMNAMIKFGFTERIKSNDAIFADLTGATSQNDQHDDHLHCGELKLKPL
jgi:hypothetical protein